MRLIVSFHSPEASESILVENMSSELGAIYLSSCFTSVDKNLLNFDPKCSVKR